MAEEEEAVAEEGEAVTEVVEAVAEEEAADDDNGMCILFLLYYLPLSLTKCMPTTEPMYEEVIYVSDKSDHSDEAETETVDVEEGAPPDVNFTTSAQDLLHDVYETLNSDCEDDDDAETDDCGLDPDATLAGHQWRFSDDESDDSDMEVTSVPVTNLPQSRYTRQRVSTRSG